MKQTLDIYTIEGKVAGKLDLPEAIFGTEVNQDLIALALRVYLANKRQGTSKVKTRGEVSKTTHKVWKQKGTGRARHGSKGAPIFVGGGVAHGPSGDQNYSLRIPKKMNRLAIKGALTQAVKDGQIMVVEGLDTVKASTKEFATVVKNLKLDSANTVIMLESPLANVVKAGKNLTNISVTQAKRTNVYEIVNADKIIIHKPAIEALVATFAEAPKAAPAVKESKTTKVQKKAAAK